ncbi:hypothetical protein N7488_000386 [Penicillium malachiteum]|nr:hypothetical protein N7488_000386 [Penicillium malachiteum]
MEMTGTSSQNLRLKDSCDRCASSKVRCSKDKPSCARCAKLGFTCLYSPARRVGRPFRPNESSSETIIQDMEPPTKALKETRFIDEGNKLFSRFSAASAPVMTEYMHGPDAGIGQNPHQIVFETQSQQNIIGQQMQTGSDCVLDIMNLLAELDVSAEQIRRIPSVDPVLLDLTSQTITTALHRLSNILRCPCSESTETGMLISALCISIIDVHSMAINKFKCSPPTTQDLPAMQAWNNLGVSYEAIGETAAMQIIGELSKVANLVLQFTERYRAIQVASGNQAELESRNSIPLDFLPALGKFMGERLQQITNNATNGLA